MNHFNIKPGDMIEWVYKYDLSPVGSREICWSQSMRQWVPINGIMLLLSISIDENKCDIIFLGKEGLFHVRVGDSVLTGLTTPDDVIPIPWIRVQ